MKDIKKELNTAINTGKVLFGKKHVIGALLNGNPKIVLVSKNCPEDVLDRVRYYTKISKTPLVTLNESSSELGSMCGKLFSISIMCIIDEGESSILNTLER